MSGEPFLFDNNVFDDDNLADMAEEEIQARLEFTKDELAAEKINSYEEGKIAGFKESEAGLTKTTLMLLQKIERDMAVLFAAEHDRSKEYEEESVHLSLCIIQKLFPIYMQGHGEAELKSAIKTALSDYNTPEKIKIELQKDILVSIEGYIKKLECSLHKEITLIPNENLNQNECNISWPNGGIICNRTNISEKILTIMKETLAERGISVHDEVEQTSGNVATTSKEDDKNTGEA